METDTVEKLESETPYCRVHYCTMENLSRRNGKTYYRCKVAGCEERETVLTGTVRIPTAPHTCPVCEGEPVLIVGAFRQYDVRLVCPGGCGFTLDVQRPDIQKRLRRTRGDADILDI